MYAYILAFSQFANSISKFLPETSVETRKAAVTLILEYIEQGHLPSAEVAQQGTFMSSIVNFLTRNLDNFNKLYVSYFLYEILETLISQNPDDYIPYLANEVKRKSLQILFQQFFYHFQFDNLEFKVDIQETMVTVKLNKNTSIAYEKCDSDFFSDDAEEDQNSIVNDMLDSLNSSNAMHMYEIENFMEDRYFELRQKIYATYKDECDFHCNRSMEETQKVLNLYGDLNYQESENYYVFSINNFKQRDFACFVLVRPIRYLMDAYDQSAPLDWQQTEPWSFEYQRIISPEAYRWLQEHKLDFGNIDLTLTTSKMGSNTQYFLQINAYNPSQFVALALLDPKSHINELKNLLPSISWSYDCTTMLYQGSGTIADEHIAALSAKHFDVMEADRSKINLRFNLSKRFKAIEAKQTQDALEELKQAENACEQVSTTEVATLKKIQQIQIVREIKFNGTPLKAAQFYTFFTDKVKVDNATAQKPSIIRFFNDEIETIRNSGGTFDKFFDTIMETSENSNAGTILFTR